MINCAVPSKLENMTIDILYMYLFSWLEWNTKMKVKTKIHTNVFLQYPLRWVLRFHLCIDNFCLFSKKKSNNIVRRWCQVARQFSQKPVKPIKTTVKFLSVRPFVLFGYTKHLAIDRILSLHWSTRESFCRIL